jgi:hypothetical protein
LVDMLQRRRFLSALAISPLVAAAPAAVAFAEDDLRRPPSRPRANGSAAPITLAPAGPIGRDLELAGGFRVVRAYGLHYGALPFVLEGEETRFQLDVLRRDAGGPSGVFESEHFSIFVHGRGAGMTSPACIRGARALGAALERRVAAGAELPAIASFAERRSQHPDAIYDVSAREDAAAI